MLVVVVLQAKHRTLARSHPARSHHASGKTLWGSTVQKRSFVLPMTTLANLRQKCDTPHVRGYVVVHTFLSHDRDLTWFTAPPEPHKRRTLVFCSVLFRIDFWRLRNCFVRAENVESTDWSAPEAGQA